jgi:hypothetical protein
MGCIHRDMHLVLWDARVPLPLGTGFTSGWDRLLGGPNSIFLAVFSTELNEGVA